MPEYHYQIKGKTADGGWSWPPLASGKVVADTSKEARTKLEEEFAVALPMGRTKGEQPFLLHLEDMTGRQYLLDRFIDMECKHCKSVYTLNEKYMLNAGGKREYCSDKCDLAFRQENGVVFETERLIRMDFTGQHKPVVYRITNKNTGLCYIGKTTQAFTLRWYQHFFQSSDTKFHRAIKETGMLDWTFELVELIDIPVGISFDDKCRLILERETFWINHYDAVKNGYNSLVSKQDSLKEVEDIIKNELPFDGNTI